VSHLASTSMVGAILALAVLLAGCAGGSTPKALGPEDELCYRFETNEAAEALDLPHGIMLAGDAPQGLADAGDRKRALTLTADGSRGEIPFAAWRPLNGDSLQVDPAVTGRIQLRMAATAEGLTGSGRPIGDVITPGRVDGGLVEGVIAVRVACTSPP